MTNPTTDENLAWLDALLHKDSLYSSTGDLRIMPDRLIAIKQQLLAGREAVRALEKLQEESVRWRGIAKTVEEAGEVLQIIGKIMAYPVGEHPDGAGPLKERLEKEVADLFAALHYLTKHNLDEELVNYRTGAKWGKFEEWVMSGIQTQQSANEKALTSAKEARII